MWSKSKNDWYQQSWKLHIVSKPFLAINWCKKFRWKDLLAQNFVGFVQILSMKIQTLWQQENGHHYHLNNLSPAI